ncbi:MAG: DUF349 domain-containing protein [Fulvivirga sp.]
MDIEKDIKDAENSTAQEQESAQNETEEQKNETTIDEAPIAEDTSEEPAATSKQEDAAPDESVQTESAEIKEEEPASKVSDDKKLDSEEDLEEKDHEDDEHEDEEVDYTSLSKEELVELIKSLAKDDRIMRSDKIVREIKPLFDEIRNAEKEEALKKFIADGGIKEDFEFKNDELINRFDANLKLIKDRKSEFVKNREQQKEKNLKRKQELLEQLRDFVDSEETNISFDEFKAIQNEWKGIGPVPGAYNRTLWANYNALIDRFYDNRSIYFELKELDRKKNLEGKLELCERAEHLANEENMKEAIKELNELHHEFKHIGPVPKDDQEPLWQRFKAASDAVYERRKGFVEQLKKDLDENLKVKEQLVEEVKSFLDFDSDRIKEWNNKTKEIIAIQKRWEATGGLPRAKAKEVNKNFWSAFKGFFNNKNAFFKKLDAGREENLEKKQELLEQAVAMQDSTDWQKTAEAFKRLQNQWRDIGPVPEKKRGIYHEFKAAADKFFENKRANNKELEKEFEKNYDAKVAICDEIEKMAKEKSDDLDTFRELRDKYLDLGFVPRKNISEIKSKYAEAVDKYINSLEGISNEDRQRIRLENQLNRIAQGPNADQKLYRKEQSLRKQIGKVESDIALWKNNIEFFADSKTADKMKDEFHEKIESAQHQLKSLKQQLKIVRTA